MIQTNPLDIYVTPAWQETVKTSYFCQAQPQLQLQLNWAGLALVLLSTPTRPPTHPTAGKVVNGPQRASNQANK